MKIDVKPGKYIVAVSGGVDSMVLLDVLSKLPELELVIAHFDHGIRAGSEEDEALVVDAAGRYGLPFAIGKGGLGPKTSEADARQARYAFLREVQEDFEAGAIITAHHQDDLIETALINVLRGTGPRGLSAIKANQKLLRPLIDVPKKEILDYAKTNNLQWREDPTNSDENYLRNYLRLKVLPDLAASDRQQLLANIDRAGDARQQIEPIINDLVLAVAPSGQINRPKFTNLPLDLAAEVLMTLLRDAGYSQFDRKNIDRALIAIKTAKAGSQHSIYKDMVLKVGDKTAWFEASS